MAALGIAFFVGLAWLLGRGRHPRPLVSVAAALGLQFALAWALLHVPLLQRGLLLLAEGVAAVLAASRAGAAFVLGPAAVDPGGPLGWVFVAQVLPVVILFATLMSVLYHYGLMQALVRGVAWLLSRSLRMTGREAVVTAANVFVGMTEAPLCVRPYLPRMSRAELMLTMTGGFATIAGSVLTAYVGVLAATDPGNQGAFAAHLITASVISAPAAYLYARLLVPPAPEADVAAEARDLTVDSNAFASEGLISAVTAGATQGLRLAANIGAMLLAIVALLALADMPLTAGSRALGLEDPVTLDRLLGWLFTPVAFLMGVPWSECGIFGALLGKKIIATEFVAYQALAEAVDTLSERTRFVASYALCGFANLGSMGVTVGMLRQLAPEQSRALQELVFPAMCAGAMASWTTACVASLLL